MRFEGPMTPYFACAFILLAESFLLFKSKFSLIVGVVTGSLLHLFVLRAVTISTASIIRQVSFYEIITDESIFPIVNFSSFALQVITLSLFIKLMPLETVKKIMNNKSFYTGLLLLALLLNMYLIYNSNIFYIDFYSLNLAAQEIVIAVFALLFLYIMLLLLIRIFNLGIYKTKTEELQVQIDKEKTLSSAVLNFAQILIELNCTTNTVSRFVVNSVDLTDKGDENLTNIIDAQSLNLTHPDDMHIFLNIAPENLITDFHKGITEKSLEYRSKPILKHVGHDNGDADLNAYYWYRMRISTRQNPTTDDIIALFTIDEIHDEKEAELALVKKAETDPLTGAYNRSAFSAKVEEHLRDGGAGTLYMFDLDNFKGINDNMGHSTGDNVLCEVHSKICAIFRPKDYIGRLGGDEFVAFLSDCTMDNIIKEKAQKICSDINKVYHAENGVDVEISCSVGICMYPKDGGDIETLLDHADRAMYHSKSIGKNTFTIYDSKSTEYKPQEKEAYMRIRENK